MKPDPFVFPAGVRDEREVWVLVLPSEGFVLVQGKPQAGKCLSCTKKGQSRVAAGDSQPLPSDSLQPVPQGAAA